MFTTYIIGAGASKAVLGFPVMKGFLADCEKYLEELRRNANGSFLEDHVVSRFGPLSQASLEDILTDLDNSLSGLGQGWYGPGNTLRVGWEFCRSCLLSIIRRRLAIDGATPLAPGVIEAYNKVLGQFRSQDRVITLNYDCGLEAFAKQMGPGNGLNLENTFKRAGYLLGDLDDLQHGLPPGPIVDDGGLPDRTPALLKLHGSVSYFSCGNPSCPSRHLIWLNEDTVGEKPMDIPVDSICHTCGGFLHPVIVPPTMSKSFNLFPKLALLWRLAGWALHHCDRIVVWGFSCPPADHHFAWLLRDTCRGRVTKVDPERPLRRVDVIDPAHESVIEQFRGLIDPNGSVDWHGFRDHRDYSPA